MTGLVGLFWASMLVILLGGAMFLDFEFWPVFLWLGIGLLVKLINDDTEDKA